MSEVFFDNPVAEEVARQAATQADTRKRIRK
jgi:hypothetical protein